MKKYAGILLLILTGCSSSQLTTSIPEEKLEQNQFSQYDPGSNIQYIVSNDANNLHVKFKTADQASIMKILKQGTQIYFDTKGKKKKKVYLEYPLAQKESGKRPDPSQDQSMGRSMSQGMGQVERSRPDMNKLIDAIPKEAIFTTHDESELIQFSLIETDIKPSIWLSGESEITYDLIIPFQRIAEGGLASMEKLSVGIVTHNQSTQSQQGGRGGGSGMGGRGGQGGGMGGPSGGMGGGGMGGGGMGGGGMGGQRGQGGGLGDPGGGSGQNNMTSAINIWFQVDLNRE